MNKEQKEIYEYEPIYSQAEIDEWMRVAEEYKEKIKELEAENVELRARLDKAVELPCKVGDVYVGICREIVPSKKGWKTKEWLENGVVVGFNTVAILTAEKAGYQHGRDIDEFDEVWFTGENARAEAEARLKELEEKKSV